MPNFDTYYLLPPSDHPASHKCPIPLGTLTKRRIPMLRNSCLSSKELPRLVFFPTSLFKCYFSIKHFSLFSIIFMLSYVLYVIVKKGGKNTNSK